MKNPHDNKPIQVGTTSAGPYIRITVDQLERVKQLLSDHGVKYWVDHLAVSVDGQPAVTDVNLGRKGDPIRAQAILDSVD